MRISENASRNGYIFAQCVRCHTRYCDATCQHDHWRRGHKQICKRIHRGGNAEQYNADKKYKEAVAVAVEACADDKTKVITLRIRWVYALALYNDKGATLDNLREAVETLDSVAQLWKRVFGEAHPETPSVQAALANAREALAARAAASSSGAA